MNEFFQKLINSVTWKNIQSKLTVDNDFKFYKFGWYFFVSPISGILKIRIIKNQKSVTDTSLQRYLGSKILLIIGCDNQNDFFKLYNFMSDNLNILNELQKRLIEVIGANKIQVSAPGIYHLKLITKRANYSNDSVYGPYYLFNAIDKSIIPYYIDKLNSTILSLDNYLNNPFYEFMYDLDGFLMYEQYLDDSVTKRLKNGKIYECQVDYINRNSQVEKQLAIKNIYLPINIKSF